MLSIARTPVRSVVLVVLVVLVAAGAATIISAQTSSERGRAVQPVRNDDCGAQLRKADGTTWKCTFHDDFDGDGLDLDNWTPLTTRTSGVRTAGQTCFISTPQTIDVSEGLLSLTTRRHRPFSCPSPQGAFWTTSSSAAVNTSGRFSQAYGRFAARMRFVINGVPGVHGTFWLFPQRLQYGPWPHSGEIDVAEALSLYSDRVFPSVHYRPADKGVQRTGWGCRLETPTEFHEFAVEWSPSQMVFSVDGRACFRHRWVSAHPLVAPQPFDQPFFLVLSQAIGNGRNAPTARTQLPATLSVDWVRVWR